MQKGEVKKRPILFNTEMVWAILNGRKTVTRRLMKPQPDYFYNCVMGNPMPVRPERYGAVMRDKTELLIKRPYNPGDVLWVRETWTKEGGKYFYRADFDSDFLDPCETLSGGYPHECAYHPGCEGCMREPQRIFWRPSIHMPREAARIFLRVNNVRVERLQDITEDDAKAEGAQKMYPYTDPETGKTAFLLHDDGTYRIGFFQIWDSTIKPKDRVAYCWESTPWVWVIEFERCDKPEDFAI